MHVTYDKSIRMRQAWHVTHIRREMRTKGHRSEKDYLAHVDGMIILK